MKKFLAIAVTVVAVLTMVAGFSQAGAAERKKIAVTGSHPSILSISGLGAVTYIGRVGDATDRLVVSGISQDPSSAVIDGRNHTLAGGLVGVGDKPGIATNLSASRITYANVSISGSPDSIQGNISGFNVERLVNYFAKQADTTITTDTVYNTGAIGGPSDYRIVYVDNAKISLMGNFTGYGVLAIRDRSATGAAPRLIMQDNAVWYGLIIIFQDYAAGATDKTYCSLVGSSSGLGDVANLASYAMIASNTFAAGNDLIFSSAYINVDAGYLGVHSSSGIFTAGNNLTLSNGGSIVANSISVGNNAVISGDVYRNSLTHGNGFSLAGSDVHPVTFPVFSLPDFPAFSAGTQDINISSSPYTLAAGDYRNITTGNGVTLNLTGGVYNIQNLSMGNSPIIQYEGSTSTLRITGDMTLGNYPIVRPKSGSGLNATNLVIYIQGVNGLSLGNSSDIKCNLYIPNGTLTVGNGANFTGCFIAKNINAGNGADSHFIGLSAFGSGGALTTPKIIGGVILQGREFDLPNTNGYNQILYCQQALENVDNLINTKGYIWEKWQELE